MAAPVDSGHATSYDDQKQPSEDAEGPPKASDDACGLDGGAQSADLSAILSGIVSTRAEVSTADAPAEEYLSAVGPAKEEEIPFLRNSVKFCGQNLHKFFSL
jgi:hypothetical protein